MNLSVFSRSFEVHNNTYLPCHYGVSAFRGVPINYLSHSRSWIYNANNTKPVTWHDPLFGLCSTYSQNLFS